ncbi:acyltransferase family protein [Paenibacillus filicis]|uniref:Acyltransferase family protein n=1 Tax=Paenibacillus filicis TaxID=669464 RepID=A0ABU9DX99_9BACL
MNEQLTKADTYFLNTRFSLIVLVVIGNMLVPLFTTHTEAQAIVTAIFMFHMPVFVLVTGYFSKGFPQHPRVGAVLLKIVCQYVLFQSIYSTLDYAFFRTEGVIYSFWAPYWMLWFLFSHLCWKVLLLLFSRLKHPLAAALLLGLAAGYLPVDGIWLSFSRTLVFFPFFLAGYYIRPDLLLQVRSRHSVRLLAAAMLAAACALTGSGILSLPLDWLMSARTYSSLQHTEWYAAVYRLGLYGVQAVTATAFLMLQPVREGKWAEMGGRTLYVFLLHGLCLKLLAAAGLYQLTNNDLLLIGLVIVTAITLTLLLSHPQVKALTHSVIDPEPELWLRKLKPMRRRTL